MLGPPKFCLCDGCPVHVNNGKPGTLCPTLISTKLKCFLHNALQNLKAIYQPLKLTSSSSSSSAAVARPCWRMSLDGSPLASSGNLLGRNISASLNGCGMLLADADERATWSPSFTLQSSFFLSHNNSIFFLVTTFSTDEWFRTGWPDVEPASIHLKLIY